MSNASSGMGVADHSKNTFLELKRKKIHRYVIFKIDEKKKEVVVEKTGGPGESYDDFTASMPEDDCRYAVYDFDYVTSENCQKSKIFFIAWFVYPLDEASNEPVCFDIGVKSPPPKTPEAPPRPSHSSAWNKATISTSPSISRIRAKMLYATSKDRIKHELDGIHYEIQATDPTEMELDVLRERAR
ncbi:hypothetical protein QJS10_CPB18g02072 [Acorus calamus]|uniref:ADF-H domain-containing protein n=1 Tax=Acorus calamus TaxID=4465 RepID=A0AAV9CLK4_ACOCL|nr:hypothetical protein QJS10_CPB18g02072 [Acorus calamus]